MTGENTRNASAGRRFGVEPEDMADDDELSDLEALLLALLAEGEGDLEEVNEKLLRRMEGVLGGRPARKERGH